MAYGDFKDLSRKAASDKALPDKNEKKDGYQRDVASMVYKFFDKKSSVTHGRSETLATQNKLGGGSVKNEITLNQQLAEELYKHIIRTFENKKVSSSFKDDISGADLADK